MSARIVGALLRPQSRLVSSLHRPSTASKLNRLATPCKRPTFAAPPNSYLASRSPFHTTCTQRHSIPPPPESVDSLATEDPTPPARMIIGFTCKVCTHRQHKYMSKHAYTKGVVIIKCDGCAKQHLIADHLGWFDSQAPPGTIEDIMAKLGRSDSITRGEVKSLGNTADPAHLAHRFEIGQKNGDEGISGKVENAPVESIKNKLENAEPVQGADVGMIEFVHKGEGGRK